MDTFSAEEIRRFLTAVDRNLEHSTPIVIIGGGAAALAHGIGSTTQDIDTFGAISQELSRAVESAQRETGLQIPIRTAGVADVPYNFEDRLERQLPELLAE